MLKSANTLAQFVLRQRKWVIALLQAFLVLISLSLAWLLRFDFRLPELRILWQTMPILIVIRLAVIARFRLMHGWWRYTGVSDAIDVLKAVSIGSGLFFIVVRFAMHLQSFPLSVYVIEPLLCASLLMGVRLGSRVLAQSVLEDRDCKRLLIIGAGHAAQMVIREMQYIATGFMVVGCIDDNKQKLNMKLHGVRVMGTLAQIRDIVEDLHVDELLIAVPSATAEQLRRFVKFCEETGKPFRMVPGIRDLIAGEATLKQIRPVELEDLLGREPVKVDLEALANRLRHKIVMVTGAAGSIGSELCRQLLVYRPERLICVDQNETGLFYLEQDLSRREQGTEVLYQVANIGDMERMASLFTENRIDIVYHAAAYKHVPLMESNVREAVRNNVFGLVNLLNVAERHGCKSFLMISSDKAVNPTSMMGATKRICELILASHPATTMRCVSVRFGNVLGSQGSVVPVFQKQLLNDKRITVTHPDITRFFMTITEAVALVLQAEAIGRQGDILVLDMGQPVRIIDLAKTLIRLSGRSEKDIAIEYTGLRPGEKLFEEMFYPTEPVYDTSYEKIKRTEPSTSSWTELSARLDLLRLNIANGSDLEIRSLVQDLVPEYSFGHKYVRTLTAPAYGTSHSSMYAGASADD